MKRSMIWLVIGLASLSMSADDYIYLKKNNVNLREAPSTSAPIAGKGKLGTVFVVEEYKDGWYKGKNPQIGESPVWISSSVSDKGYVGDVNMPAWNIVHLPIANTPYENTERSAGGDVQSTWTFTSPDSNFWTDEKPGSDVEAFSSIFVVYSNGHARTYETKYKGLAYPYYLMLTEESKDEGERYTKLESPIYVYPSIGVESGIYVDGVFFKDADVLYEGDW